MMYSFEMATSPTVAERPMKLLSKCNNANHNINYLRRSTHTGSAFRSAMLCIFGGWPTAGFVHIARQVVITEHVAGWGGMTSHVAPLSQGQVVRRKQRRRERVAPARQLAHLLQHRILLRPSYWVG